ncbi:mor transcription activator family protein [[Haemophilus] ducreyi]|uniref:Mor transcription activator domain-containing protein n=2 Tax=Haemophilus ducreyi TaxID=730 RepID=Q7VNK9_HAEDU|nr:Mor transcription activator family protein [[Haemophilus] ducreyi]AAP95450.1 hypothetical protein HD_0500 [[Haemophilus] ducreyi 35000HP]AKO30554.1 mor transcription activator family protein [[Haemophilus] ducreyi]AKO31991.1 mor transcription activator family protein [[Haemophilus] ducreyi]AKO33446.1 mor transcription activator family protein [[Haemophilus] ducreyi]AKO34893.1 mor transcription activator family protein [[Haemophilus] ducreyi]
MQFENVQDYLPECVQTIVDVIGLPATEKLVRAFGGFSFQFSRSKTYFDRLRDILGQEDAVKLQQFMDRSEVYIPRCEVALRMLRNQKLYADFCYLTQHERLSGRLAILQLCQKYQVSDRTAWDVVRAFQRQRNYTKATLF